ncbi:NADH-quinone oxidoreductase subunit N [Salisediminibacterium selenitireducens]|uniref:NADH-quinone oxidoreductase subunit N n=1 Tax=Bacillus selenitireducens (strain ATCC 700615 / DSM 15326 / MLS10) TaxID=439292 RepID=D6Y0Q4_BACIE|nr:NADH-quinone oxidoreductase subunit N [Salisediminibacterium selenitireducens]ADI00622.1 proton-translocating NADH-quinone oxidoreductase, chain N [[Bacillus] selenitireducens MLS10]
MLAFNADWSLMTPEIVLGALALLVFTLDFMTGIHRKKPFIGHLSVLSLAVTAVLVVVMNTTPGSIGATFIVDPFAMVFKLIILIGVALVILSSLHFLDNNDDMYQGEYYSILLFTALGGMIMVSSADLITLFIGLEILSISSYALAGFKKYNTSSTEAAIKYLVLGGTASAFILYGMSFLFGLTGTTNVYEIGQVMPELFADYPQMMIIAFVMMLAGFGFKISAVPFHMWAPDVYYGAPTPITGFLSAVSKLAGFAIVIRVFTIGFGGVFEEWAFIIATLAAITMITGNFIALTQTDIKRLMAFSGIAQAGYLLVPLATVLGNASTNIIAFYSVAYVLMTLGAFAIITLVTEDAGGKTGLDAFAGLYKRSPYMAIALTIFFLSLAGMPFTAGFIGKANIFILAITGDMLWLAIIMIVTSIISFFYYFGVMKQMFMVEPKANDETLKVPTSINAVVSITLAATIILGVLPNLLFNIFTQFNWMAFF